MLEPKDWDEVHDSTGTEPDTDLLNHQYTDLGGFRCDNDDVYAKVNGGWIELDQVVDALNEFLEYEQQQDILRTGGDDD